MEENIMTMTEEFVETAEDIAIPESNNSVGIGLAIGAAVTAVGALAYKFIVKPIVKKVKAKKAQKATEAEENLTEVDFESTVSDEE